eukprot:9240482-Lingulodinium_polyedra.AAC.1
MYSAEFKRLTVAIVGEPLVGGAICIDVDSGVKKDSLPLRRLIRMCLLQTGAIHRSGKAPAGALERELSSWLAPLE